MRAPYEERGRPDVHPLVQPAFEALDANGVDWLLLRGLEELAQPTGDVDVLVHPSAVPRIDAVLASAGFVRLPARGHGSHRFYLSYDTEQDEWAELDVVSEVAFGRFQEFPTDAGPALLARRRRRGDVAVPANADAFWHLLLHYLVDRGDVPERRRQAVRPLAPEAGDAGPLAGFVEGTAPGMAVVIVRGPVRPQTASGSRSSGATGRGRRRWRGSCGRRFASRLGMSIWVSRGEGGVSRH